MSPKDIKALRTDLGLTQASLAEALGLVTLMISQYETGVRRPGPTALILLSVLDSLPKKHALELIELFRKASIRIGRDRKDSAT